MDNRLVDGPRIITVTARATGFLSGVAELIVTDNEAASSGSAGGKVTLPSTLGGLPVPGVVLTLRQGTRLKDRVVTLANGTYLFSRLPIGSYTVTPTKAAYLFSPFSRSIVLSRTVMAPKGIDFFGTPRPQISGVLTRLDADGVKIPLPNITVVARSSKGALQIRTSSRGTYLFDRVPLGSYLVTPQQTGTFFTPKSRAVAITPALPTVTPIDFAAAGTDTVVPRAVTVMQPGMANFTQTSRSTLSASGTAADDSTGSGLAVVTVAIGRFASATSGVPNGLWNWNQQAFISLDSPLLVESLAGGTTTWSLNSPAALANLRSLTAGFYGIRATAVDNAGNIKRSLWKRFRITPALTAWDELAPAEKSGSVAATSPVRISTASARSDQQQIVLTFTSALDWESAVNPANYSIEVNGQIAPVEIVSYGNGTVTIGVPQSTLTAEDAVSARWHDLRDAQGRLLADSQTTIVAR